MEAVVTLKCKKGFPAASLCEEEGCSSHALICNMPDCECYRAHLDHTTTDLVGAVQRLSELPRLSGEALLATNIVAGLLKGMQDQLQRLVSKHDRYLSGKINQSCSFADVKRGLLGKAMLPSVRVTGENVYRVMT